MSKIYIPEGLELMNLINKGEYICNNCGAIMDITEDPDGGCEILVCPNCGEEVDEMDYEYEFDDDEYDSDKIPKGCIACGGPYPQCTTSCKLFDD